MPELRRGAGELDPLLLATGEGRKVSVCEGQAARYCHYGFDNRGFRVARPWRAAHTHHRVDRPVETELRILAHHCPAA